MDEPVRHPVFDHEGPWTEDAYLALPRDGRLEVVDGTLLVGPGTSDQRARMVERVRAAVASALPGGLRVIGPVPLRLGPDCVLVPDLVVTSAADEPAGGDADATAGTNGDSPDAARDPAADPASGAATDVLEAAAALMVIEVVGRDHGATDRTFKPQLYARSRIPYSLLIDHDGQFAVADMIIGGRYHEYARAGDDELLRIEEPFGLELDLRAATSPEEDPATVPAAGEPHQ